MRLAAGVRHTQRPQNLLRRLGRAGHEENKKHGSPVRLVFDWKEAPGCSEGVQPSSTPGPDFWPRSGLVPAPAVRDPIHGTRDGSCIASAGARWQLRSSPGEGSCFTLWLPTLPPPEEELLEDADEEHPGGLTVVGEAILADVRGIARTFVSRLREDPLVPTGEMGDADLEDHLATMLTDFANTLVAIERVPASPRRLLRDGSEIQRIVADLHGAQRAELGWNEASLRREHQILREVLETWMRERSDAGARGGGRDVLRPVRRFLARSEQISVRSFVQVRVLPDG